MVTHPPIALPPLLHATTVRLGDRRVSAHRASLLPRTVPVA